MEGLDIKLQNSGLPYSNVAALPIRSAMCLSKTSAVCSSTCCVPEYVTVDNYEDNLEILCLNGNTFHRNSCHSSGGQSSPSQDGELNLLSG